VGLRNCSRAVIFIFILNLGGCMANFARKKKNKKIYSVFGAEGNRPHFSGGKKNRQI
jgi:hypothetical protein